MRSSDTPEAITDNNSEERKYANHYNKDRICTEESCKSLSVSLQYSSLNVNLNPQKSPIERVPTLINAKNETEAIAKTILLTFSQPAEPTFQMQSYSAMDPGAYLKMAQKSMQRITPFHGEEPIPERGILPRVQISRLLKHRRNTTEPAYYQKSFPIKEPRRRFSQVAIITPLLKHPKQQEQGRVCGSKEWKKAFCAAKRQHQSIRKSGSVSVCRVLQQDYSFLSADALDMVIKSLIPGAGVRSHSLPMKVESKVKDYIQASNKSIRVDGKKDPLIRLRQSLIRVNPLLKARQSEQKKARLEFDFSKFQNMDRSNLFRKLNAFRQKKEKGCLQQKLLRLESQYEGERLHGQADSKLATSIGYRLTNTIYFKNRQPSSSFSRYHPT